MIAIVPARKNSRRFPGKNRMTLRGQGLLEKTVKDAQKSGLFEQVIVSTDDPELVARAISSGAGVPFPRPPELALDATSTWEVVRHLVDKLNYEGEIMLLQVTSPFREPHHLVEAAEMRSNFGLIPTISIISNEQVKTNDQMYYWCPCHPVISAEKNCEYSEIVNPNGAIYLLHTNDIPTSHALNLNGCLGYLMSARESLDIDYKHQLDEAEGMTN